MRRFAFGMAALAIVACSAERTENVASDTLRATSNPIRCEGVAGIKKLALKSKGELVGFSTDRVFLRAGTKCVSAQLDGLDPKPCPAPDAKTSASTLLGQDVKFLYFQGTDADGDVLFRASIADGTSKTLFHGKADAKLAGDRLIWSDQTALWSIPTAGGTPKKIYVGSVIDFAVNGEEIMVAGRGGAQLVGDGQERVTPLVSTNVDAIAISPKTIAFRDADSFSTVDRETSTTKKLWTLPATVKAHGLSLDHDTIVTYLDDQVFARIASDKPAALISSKLGVANVTHHAGDVIWSIGEQYFSVNEASFGKATIKCTDQPLSAPVGDAGADATSEPPAKDAGAKTPEPAPSGDDDDDIQTSTDPTEPENPGSTVVIHPACSSVPGATTSSFGVVLGLGLLALRRRRR